QVAENLKKLSRGHGATMFMTLLAAFEVLLSRYSGNEDIVVGTQVAGRGSKDLENLIGLFANTLVLRTAIEKKSTLRQTLNRVRETVLASHEYQDMPFERIVDELNPERSLSLPPLFQVAFSFQNAPWETWHLPNLSLQRIALENPW